MRFLVSGDHTLMKITFGIFYSISTPKYYSQENQQRKLSFQDVIYS